MIRQRLGFRRTVTMMILAVSLQWVTGCTAEDSMSPKLLSWKQVRMAPPGGGPTIAVSEPTQNRATATYLGGVCEKKPTLSAEGATLVIKRVAKSSCAGDAGAFYEITLVWPLLADERGADKLAVVVRGP